jgi:hypothetical protein
VDVAHVDEPTAKKYGVAVGSEIITYDFVLVTDEETRALREKNAKAAMEAQGRKMRFLDGLPIPEVD